MKKIEKKKAQRLINKIQTGNFDYNDIDALLFILRPYGKEYKVFREFADFVAHNDIRDRGLVQNSIKYLYLSLKYYNLYVINGRKVNLFHPIPLWLKKFIIYQIDNLDDLNFFSRLGYTKQKYKHTITKAFKKNKKEGLVTYDFQNFPVKTLLSISELFKYINISKPLDLNEIFDDIFKLIKKNTLKVEAGKFLSLKEIIILNLILLLHNTEYKLDKNEIAQTRIQCLPNNTTKVIEIFVVGIFKLDKNLFINHKIISTNLLADNYIDDTILNNKNFKIDDIISLPEDIDIEDNKIILS